VKAEEKGKKILPNFLKRLQIFDNARKKLYLSLRS